MAFTGLMSMFCGQEEGFKQKVFGVQPFLRPQKQFALGMSSIKEHDHAKIGWTVQFQQSQSMSKKIHDIFYPNGKDNTLFPPEEVANVANSIKENKSQMSIRAVKNFL